MGRVFCSGSGVVMASSWLVANFARPVRSRPNALSMRATSSAMTRRAVRPSSALSVQGSEMYRLPPWRTRPGCAGVEPPVAFQLSSSLSATSPASVPHMVCIRSKVFWASRPSGATEQNSSRLPVSRIAAISRLAANSVLPLPRATASSSAFVAGVSERRPSITRRLASRTIATMHCQGIQTSGWPAPASAPCPHFSAKARASSARCSSHQTAWAAGFARSAR